MHPREPQYYPHCYNPGPYHQFSLIFPPFISVLSVTHSPLVPLHATRTATESPDKSPDGLLDHSAVNYHMPSFRSLQHHHLTLYGLPHHSAVRSTPQHHHLTLYGLPAHDALFLDCQLMMELYLELPRHDAPY